MAQRLPVPGSDDNTWGDVLNGFLGVAHNSDGTIMTNVVLHQPDVDFIDDTNGSKEIELVATASSANWVRLTNTTQGNGVTIGVNGTAANENLTLAALGTGTVQVGGSQVTTAANTQVLTNKTISGASNTLSAIPESAVTNLTTDLAAKQGTITLATTGTGGVATFSNNTLNIPNYASSFAQVANQTSSFTAQAGYLYPVDASSAAVTVTLPTSSASQSFIVKKTDASTNVVTLSGTINGTSATTFNIIRQNQSKQLVADGGGGWTIVAGDIDIALTGATSSALGFIQLTGDLGGTASAPTTPTAVHTSGDETVNGHKSFGNDITLLSLNSVIKINNYSSTQYDVAALRLFNSASTITGPAGVQLNAQISDAGITTTVFKADVIDKNQTVLGNLYSFNLTTYVMTMNGGINLSNNNIVNLATPVNPADAATKAYVDSKAGTSFTRTITQVTAAATAGSAAQTDYVYWWSGATAYTLTMPTAVGNTDRYTLKNSSSVSQPIATTSSQTIEGGSSITISPNNSVDLISNGANWMVI